MEIMTKNGKSYEWTFSTIGGVTRVNIESGADIAHLHELDQKMWTVLSCPVKGLEIDERTLQMLDTDCDGKIRVAEVVAAAQWLTKVLVSPNFLLKKADILPLSEINQKDEEGRALFNSAQQILKNLGRTEEAISVADVSDRLAIFEKTRFNGDGVITENSSDDDALRSLIAQIISVVGATPDRSGAEGVNAAMIENFYTHCADFAAWQNEATARAADIFPFGEKTADAYAAYEKMRAKVDDYFLRCKMASFNNDAGNILGIQPQFLADVSNENLPTHLDAIAAMPLMSISATRALPLSNPVNPAWEADFLALKELVISAQFPDNQTLTYEDWQAIGARFEPYKTWLANKKGAPAEALGIETVQRILADDRKAQLLDLVQQDLALEAEANAIENVDKLLHLCRDFYTLLRNFVTFSDFYTLNSATKAIFQAGTLYIDQRSCDLCMRVSDMAKHNTTASFSGMYLVYCDCVSKHGAGTMQIVAVITMGSVNNLMVGKNAIFYDRAGHDWDATITKIIDNPISIGQAFWSPYRKFARFIEDKINQFAAKRDDKMTADTTGKLDAAGDQLVANAATAAKNAPTTDKTKTQAFDIAKFCGIFAAIGLALGYIGKFLIDAFNGFVSLHWWQMPLAILGIILLISAPSMIMAWLKLRKRNLSPVLNANGWAVNAQAYVNIRFGATLTKQARFPKLNVPDPFVKKGTPAWVFVLIGVAVVCAALAILFYFDLISPFWK